jgi:hypothetical protein
LRTVLVVLLALGLALGIACGGGDDDAGSSAAEGSSTGGESATADASPAAGTGGGGGGGGSTLPEACALLSEEQVNAALSDDTVASSGGDPPTQALSTCQWQGTSGGNRYVSITIRTAQHGAQVFENSYKSMQGAVAVSGIGDEAYAITGADMPNNYRFLTMATLTSSLFIQLNIAGPNRSDDEALSTLTTSMEQVLASLQ